MKIQIIPLIILLSISFILAVDCSPTSITTSYFQGDDVSSSIQCSNDKNYSVSISKTGDFLISDSVIGASPSSKTITLSFNPDAPIGLNTGSIDFSDLTTIPVFFNVQESVDPVGCFIDIFPTTLTNVKVQQGETKTRNIQLSVPSCYDSPVTVNGVALQSDERPIQLGELQIGTIQPGNSVVIPIDINAEGISTGQYSDTLQFLLYDDEGNKINVPSVSVSVLVSQGIQPINNFSLSDLPTCSIDDIDLNLNSTYKLTCSLTNPNIDIRPLIDSKFLKGVSVDETSSQYIYRFQPILIGETSINADFLYKFAPLGTPFTQELRISYSGNSPVSGTLLKVIFYQDDKKTDIENLISGYTRIVLVDNKTDSEVEPKKISLNGIEIENNFTLEPDKDYDLRISADGYVDLVNNFTVTPKPIEITLEPFKEIYAIGDKVNLSSNVESCNFLIDDLVIDSPYTFNSPGDFKLKAVKLGYNSTIKNITVKGFITYKAMTPQIDEWKKGEEVIVELSKNSSWEVLKDGVVVSSGEGGLVEFEIEDYGEYQIKAGGNSVLAKNIEKGNTWYKPWTWKWVINIGYWWILILSVLGVFVWYFFIRETEEDIPVSYHQGGEYGSTN